MESKHWKMFQTRVKDGVLEISNSHGVLFRHPVIGKDETGEVFGVFGSIAFNGNDYLILIQNAQEAGLFGKFPVFEVKGVKIHRLIKDETEKNANEAEKLMKCITEFFKMPGMYFSEAQLHLRNHFNEELGKISSAIDGTDLEKRKIIRGRELYKHEFLFNGHAIEHFNKLRVFSVKDGLVLQCIQGYFGRYKDLILISRRCPKMIGSRYFSRGINKKGYPSNFIETEQFILNKNSYLHLRGSIPLVWKHSLGFAYKPAIQIEHKSAATSAKTAHRLLEKIYNRPIVYLNLIHEDGYEKELYKTFNKYYGANYSLYNYDFKKNINKVDFPIKFVETGLTSSKRAQKVIIRTNCIDCLDRTNSMQYFIGEMMLKEQLCDTQITHQEEIVEYEKALKVLFYTNGNNLSLQYAGTEAQGWYFITHGSGYAFGYLGDLYLSIRRYFLNRYRNGQTHNAYEVLTGARISGNILERSDFQYFKLIFFTFPLFIFLLLSKAISGIFKPLMLSFLSFIVVFFIISMDYPLSYFSPL